MARPCGRPLLVALCLSLSRATRAASWASLNCTEVSFDTLQATREQSRWPVVGPIGVYAYTPSRHCIYLNGSLDGSFAQQNPNEFAGFVAAVQEFQAQSGYLDLDFMHQGKHPWPNVSEPAGHEDIHMVGDGDVRPAECGDFCNGSGLPTVTCTTCRNVVAEATVRDLTNRKVFGSYARSILAYATSSSRHWRGQPG
ncbi:hypothetical protein B0T24DRAFT_591463 [Lasiosphaeria ovina]|uniref:Killer toxin Kp4 domain-containing protein n=1 Tax=Lasiosphaeria ovina TaxID=92902 RepID=A0AAE0KFI7_9PEZI|nr:hypothetical protein B0T24DRAFT_591463 [Lasiosphaeria ovina]